MRNEGRKGSLSRIRQADGTIRFNLYQIKDEDTSFSKSVKIRINIDDGNGQRWETMEVTAGMYLSELVGNTRKKYQLGPDLFRVYVPSLKQYISEDRPIMPMVEETEKQGKKFELILQREVNPPKNSRVALPPVRDTMRTTDIPKSAPKRKSTTLYKPEPIVTATYDKTLMAKLAQSPRPRKNSSIKADALTNLQLSLFNFMNGTEIVSPRDQVLDYDSMLHTLDQSINNNLQEPTVYQVFDDLERDIENIIAAQLEKASENRRRSRLSQIYNSEKKDDIDAEKLFADLKNTGSDLNRLESVMFC
jgi:hypothetical protein